MKNNKLNILILVVASLIVSYFILKDDFLNVMTLIVNINIGWVLFSVFIVVCYWFFQTMCLVEVSSTSDEKVTFRTLFTSTLVCNFFSAITPSATGGQPFQIFYLKKKGLKLGTATNFVVAQSTFYQIALVLFGLIAIILNHFYAFFPADHILNKLVLIGFVVNVVVIAILCYVSFGKKSNKYIVLKFIKFLHKIKIIRDVEKTSAKVEHTVDTFYESAKALNSNRDAVIKGVIYNFIALALLYITPLTVAYAFGDFISLNIITTLVASAYVMLIGAFVPIPGGSGGIEYAFVTFFGFYIVGPTLMAILLIWRFITYYLSILVGGLTFIIGRDGGK